MIMEWKKQGDSFCAIWRGTHLTLALNTVTNRWSIKADNLTVRQTWSSSRKAMDDIEIRLQKIVVQAAKDQAAKHGITLVAPPAPASVAQEVRHGRVSA
jgi:hypothetical protein